MWFTTNGDQRSSHPHTSLSLPPSIFHESYTDLRLATALAVLVSNLHNPWKPRSPGTKLVRAVEYATKVEKGKGKGDAMVSNRPVLLPAIPRRGRVRSWTIKPC